MEQIDIGFIEKCEPWRLESRYFPSKIGGKPAWLDLKHLPTAEDIKCRNCETPCAFLCQVYAPYEDEPEAFHRTIFVFICKNESCCKPNDNGNLRVLRSQLPRENRFYPSSKPVEDKEEWRPDIKASSYTKLCEVCSVQAPNRCAKCKEASYCCREHQVLDWKSGHKKSCNSDDNDCSSMKNPFLFPEFELVIERDDLSIADDDEKNIELETKELDNYKRLVEAGQAGSLHSESDVDKDLLQMANSEEDEAFIEFQLVIKRDPDQVLRYHRGAKPLYISSQNQGNDIPRCDECHGERQFEFQIMPQLLNHLGFEDVLKSLDWGILAIFTCAKSCTPKSGYVHEFIWKQDIVECKSEKAE